ncbi:hypothetical protein M9458_053171 [Cirrhinus mrigala]|uniref:CCHC-type domain-containing protein n=1 Tax=Cirrhinus mrigala TaxID=683832 RepID=A0ABD0MNL6_CIRMR
MSMEAEITCNPVTSFSALRASDPTSEKQNLKDSRRNRANVFHVQTATKNNQNEENEQQPTKGNFKMCFFCKDSKHKIHNCPKFVAKSLEEKRKYVKENELCYGCMKPSHSAKDCRYRLSCNTCRCRHPTCLHDENYTKKVKSGPISNQGDAETTNATSHKVEIDEPSTNTSIIVPVWVSTERNPGCEKLVYALLDTQSDTVFVERELSNMLQADSYPVRLKLTTMTAKDVVMPSERVSGLRVRGYSSSVVLNLPSAYTKDFIPVNRTHIPTCDTAQHWRHLSTIVDKIPPLQDCEVGLLTGFGTKTDVPPISCGRSRPKLPLFSLVDECVSLHPQEYRMKVHLFGATSSPGCANYSLKHLANANERMYPLGSKFITADFYVDDGVTSVASTEEAIQVARQARQLCASGGLRLHKFISNDRVLLDSTPISERAIEVKALDLNFDDTPLERALGIHWDIDSDSLRFSVDLKDQPATRHGILSTVASLYDPLGFIAPSLLSGKLVLQEMCRNGTGWNDPLPKELQPRWEHWKADLVNLERINIPHCYVPANFGKVIKRELYHFSDASNSGYGQCSYLRLTNEEGNIHCKSRVAPIKVQTIPRLELTATVISVAMSNMLKQELDYADIEEHFWTDSQVVLGCINNGARCFHTFVPNRVQKIHLSTTPLQWRYVPTNENPADHASRGLNADIDTTFTIGDPEVRQAQTLSAETKEVSLSDRLSKLSSWSGAVQVVARLIRRPKGDKSCSHSMVAEREDAKRIIIKDLQRNTYPEDIKLLSKGAQLSPSSKLYHLDAFLDQGGVLKGRKDLKRYGLLFTCFSSRAIHIEMLDDMSTDAFINGLRCFVALRGLHDADRLTGFYAMAIHYHHKADSSEDIYARKRWCHVQYLSEQFWSRWRKEYLSNIATRQRWHTAKRNLRVGDIVMEKGEILPRNESRLARVTETTTDKDGLVRRVNVCLGDRNLGKDGRRLNKLSVVERPVQKLILLLETV